MAEYIYKVINRKNGKIPNPRRGIGPLNQIYWNGYKWRHSKQQYDVIQYELVVRKILPITNNADFDEMMFHSFGDEKYKPKQ